MEQFFFIGNSLAYLGLLVYFLFFAKGTGYRLIALSTAVFFISSIFSNLYFKSPLYFYLTDRGLNDVSATALCYILVSFLIFIQPLKKLNLEERVTYPRIHGKDILSAIVIIVGVLSIIPFFENLIYVMKMSMSDFTNAYQLNIHDKVSDRSHLSAIGHFCNGIVSWLKYVNPVLLFWAIAKKKNKWIILLSSLAFFNPVLLGLIKGGRGALFGTISLVILNFLLFKNSFSKDTQKKVYIIGGSVIAFLSVFLLIMTINRAGDNQSLANQEIYRYLGEGFVNFAETGWHTQAHTDGHSIINGTGFTFFKHLSDFFNSRDYAALGRITHFRMYVYYTVFGDYYLDFGLIGGLLFNSLLAFLFFLAVRKNPMSFSSLILINMYVKLALTGYGCFCYMNYAEFVIFTLLICALSRLFEPKLHKVS